MDEKHLIQDALHDAVARFEQRMNDDTVSYGNLQDWLVGNAFSRFQSLFEKAQKEKARLLPSKQLNCRPSRLIKKKILWSF